MTQVFISYSRNDMEFVQRLAGDLLRAGLDVWWDLSDIQGSDVWERKIQEGLNSSQFFIVVLTPASLDSRWVRREYLSADNKGLKIIPLKLKPNDELPLTLRDIQPIDAVNHSYDVTLAEILKIVNGKSQTGSVDEKDAIVPNSNVVEVSRLGDPEEKISAEIRSSVNSVASPTLAPMGLIERGAAILPIVYFILAGLHPFGFDNNEQKFFLGIAAILTGVFFMLDRRIVIGRWIKPSIIIYVLIHVAITYSDSSGWDLANIPDALEGLIALVIVWLLISNFRSLRKPAPYASVFLGVFFCIVGAKILLNQLDFYPSDIYTLIIVAGIVASVLLWLDQ